MSLVGADGAARRTFRTAEPVHAVVYFAPEALGAYGRLGLDAQAGYFASRSAPMGAVPHEVVAATFFNFNPELVRSSMEGVWDRTSPAAVLGARLEVADASLRRMLGDAVASPEMAKVAQLARVAAEAACEWAQGRPLFSGHAALEWPDPHHLVLWHAQSLLREFRGDGHVALLVAACYSPVEALVAHAATGEVPLDTLRTTRQWPAAAWEAAAAALEDRGELEPGPGPGYTLTALGAERRRQLEEDTDRLAAHPYEVLGEKRCAELRRLVRPLSRLIVSQWTAPQPPGR